MFKQLEFDFCSSDFEVIAAYRHYKKVVFDLGNKIRSVSAFDTTGEVQRLAALQDDAFSKYELAKHILDARGVY